MISENYFLTVNNLVKDDPGSVVYVLGFDEKFIYISPSVEQLLGFTPEEVIGKKIHHFITPQSYEMQFTGLQKVIAEKNFEAEETMTIRAFKKDGSKIWVKVNVKFIKSEVGLPEAILGIFKATTDQIQHIGN